MADVLDEMTRIKRRVDQLILERLLPSSSPIQQIDLLYRMMRDYPARSAKGIRPVLCVATCRAFGGREDDALVTAACVEILQNWILIHDDIEDQSDLRRGEPALHRKYDERLALNAGDALHARMWGSLLQNTCELGAEKSLRVLEEFSRIVNATTEGQHIELGWVVSKSWAVDEADYFAMVSRKTGWYTVAGPCRLGAIVGGAAASELDKLLDFGLKLGIAFQIRDDTLNLVGDGDRHGKRSADDILEGKRTLILLELLKAATVDERECVIAIMDKPKTEKTAAEVGYVLDLVRRYGAVDYARAQAHRLLAEAFTVLDTVRCTGDREAFALIRDVATFSIRRQW